LIVPVELVLPVVPLTAGVFDTQVLKHVMLAGPIVKLVLLLLIGFSVVSWAIIFLKFRLLRGICPGLSRAAPVWRPPRRFLYRSTWPARSRRPGRSR